MSSNEVTSTKGEPEKALDYLGEVRDQLNGSFSRSAEIEEVEQLDIEHNISVIRAILAVNSAIFSRCMEHAETKLTGEKTELSRFGFETIKTRQEGKKLELVTHAERFVQTFDTHPLSRPPTGFDEIIVVKYKPFTKFIDFEDLFRKTLLLNDDALEFLLPKLKDHLESVQVCLGELDEWALQPMKNASFINSVFNKDFTMPMEMDHYRNSLKCWYCGSSTVVPLSNAPFPPISATAPKNPLTGKIASGSAPIPVGFGACFDGSSTVVPSVGLAPEPFSFGAIHSTSPFGKVAHSSMCTKNKCKQVHVLAEFNVSFIYQDSFDVSQENEQMKLRRFLYFVKGA
ncbi:hypothetical protein ACHAXA_010705 [Cyclostephanos tholiformis]|uniref:Uncharacterized protein n=1 Tax=Cyclostephanos tholiformis TaxID=382380 RepID=A0ABD3SF26_9STRA